MLSDWDTSDEKKTYGKAPRRSSTPPGSRGPRRNKPQLRPPATSRELKEPARLRQRLSSKPSASRPQGRKDCTLSPPAAAPLQRPATLSSPRPLELCHSTAPAPNVASVAAARPLQPEEHLCLQRCTATPGLKEDPAPTVPKAHVTRLPSFWVSEWARFCFRFRFLVRFGTVTTALQP